MGSLVNKAVPHSNWCVTLWILWIMKLCHLMSDAMPCGPRWCAKSETSSRKPPLGTTSRKPPLGTTSRKPQFENHMSETTRQKPQVGIHKSETTSRKPQFGNHNMETTIWKPQFGNHNLETTIWKPLGGNHKSETISRKAQFGNHNLGTTCWKPPVRESAVPNPPKFYLKWNKWVGKKRKWSLPAFFSHGNFLVLYSLLNLFGAIKIVSISSFSNFFSFIPSNCRINLFNFFGQETRPTPISRVQDLLT